MEFINQDAEPVGHHLMVPVGMAVEPLVVHGEKEIVHLANGFGKPRILQVLERAMHVGYPCNLTTDVLSHGLPGIVFVFLWPLRKVQIASVIALLDLMGNFHPFLFAEEVG